MLALLLKWLLEEHHRNIDLIFDIRSDHQHVPYRRSAINIDELITTFSLLTAFFFFTSK